MTSRLLAFLLLAGPVGALPAQDPAADLARALAARVDSLEAAGRWAEAVPHLQRYLVLVPRDPARLRQLGLYLSWSGHRASGLDLLERALAERPGDVVYLASYAEVLSWQPEDQARAREHFDRALAADPEHVPALVAYGEMLSWNPVTADSAGRVFERALALEPDNLRARDGLRVIRESVRRAAGAFVELGGVVVDRRAQLDAVRGGVRVSLAAGEQLRLDVQGEAVRFEDPGGRLDGGRLGLVFRYDPDLRFGMAVGGSRQTGDRAGAGWDGFGEVRLRAGTHLRIRGGFERALVEESRRSVRLGVRANLARAVVEVRELPGRFDLVGRGIAGRYTGSGLASNARMGVEGEVGWVLRTYRPWVRIGYEARYATFDFNAAEGYTPATDSLGGYFSPDRYAAHFGLMQIGHRFGQRVQWTADGRGGVEIVRQERGSWSDNRGAAVVTSELTVLLGPRVDVGLWYLYVDAFDVFRMHQGRVVLRHYF